LRVVLSRHESTLRLHPGADCEPGHKMRAGGSDLTNIPTHVTIFRRKRSLEA
jgi:hypothetical protein